LERRKNQN